MKVKQYFVGYRTNETLDFVMPGEVFLMNRYEQSIALVKAFSGERLCRSLKQSSPARST